jgi:hypothetical protein
MGRGIEIIKIANLLDSREQYRMADRMEKLAAIDDEELYQYEPHPKDLYKFDPENSLFGGMADEVSSGNKTRPFETVEGPPGITPYDEYVGHDAIDENEVWDIVLNEMREMFPEFIDENCDDDEFISRVVHGRYMNLKNGDNTDRGLKFVKRNLGSMEYDKELLEQAKKEVSDWISSKFQDAEEGLQQN